MARRRMVPDVRREQILEQAICLIGHQGYNGVTVQELARQCGLTNGGLLHYFGSKEQLLIAILEERDRREAAIIVADLDFGQQPPDRIECSRETILQVFRAIVARSVAQPELLRFLTVLQSEALNRKHPAHDYFQRREAMVLDEFAFLVTGHAEAPRKMARRILALIMGLEQQWLRADQGFDLVEACDEAIALILPSAQAALVTNEALAST